MLNRSMCFVHSDNGTIGGGVQGCVGERECAQTTDYSGVIPGVIVDGALATWCAARSR